MKYYMVKQVRYCFIKADNEADALKNFSENKGEMSFSAHCVMPTSTPADDAQTILMQAFADMLKSRDFKV